MQSTSLVGTVNRARRDIPQSIKTIKAPLYVTVVMKKNETILTVYQGKKKKNFLVLSTLHPNISIGNDQKHLPETVSFYNATKNGVNKVVCESSITTSASTGFLQHNRPCWNKCLGSFQANCQKKNISPRVFLQMLSVELRSVFCTVKTKQA
ncbi:hypothetical protein PR048_005154 [Dryococelus australis]|uniref:Uncharacterized protein n=1 Tax=Dryococelus australis TaxID=614101 RepID=A0ABQ9I7E1_9NEOP|nr:hypothetical protein PR048_005154 [Dryococelus australis]